MDKDIAKIRKILKHNKKEKLAELLYYSKSELNVSATFGSMAHSLISTFEIHSPIEHHNKLNKLKKIDKKEIFNTVLLIYPVRENEPEITEIQFYVDAESIDKEEPISSEILKNIDSVYILEQLSKCKKKLLDGDYDGAITNSRTLVETVLADIYFKCTKNKLDKTGDLLKDYKKIKELLNLTEEKYSNESIKGIIRSFNGIINNLDSLSNIMGDRHRRRVKPEEHHARLVVNSAITISDFLYSSMSYQSSRKTNIFNELIISMFDIYAQKRTQRY